MDLGRVGMGTQGLSWASCGLFPKAGPLSERLLHLCLFLDKVTMLSTDVDASLVDGLGRSSNTESHSECGICIASTPGSSTPGVTYFV